MPEASYPGESLVPECAVTVLAEPKFKHCGDDVRVVAEDCQCREVVFELWQK
jgi:hypothetical protein